MKKIRFIHVIAVLLLAAIFIYYDTHKKPFKFSKWSWYEWILYGESTNKWSRITIGAKRYGPLLYGVLARDYGLLAFAKRENAEEVAAQLSSFPGCIYIVTEDTPTNINEIAIATIYGHHKLQFVIQPKENKIESRAGIQIISNSQIPQTEAQWFELIKLSGI